MQQSNKDEDEVVDSRRRSLSRLSFEVEEGEESSRSSSYEHCAKAHTLGTKAGGKPAEQTRLRPGSTTPESVQGSGQGARAKKGGKRDGVSEGSIRSGRGRSLESPAHVSEASVVMLESAESTDSAESTADEERVGPSGKYWQSRSQKRKRSAVFDSGSGSGGSPSGVPNKIGTPKRGRGRPPTTGQYVGLAKAKAELAAAKEKELRLRLEEEVANHSLKARESFSRLDQAISQTLGDGDNRLSADLQTVIANNLDVIMDVGKKSRNLKGTFVRAIKDSVEAISTAVKTLSVRTTNEEVAKLQADNNRLQSEVERLRRENEALRAEQADLRREFQTLRSGFEAANGRRSPSPVPSVGPRQIDEARQVSPPRTVQPSQPSRAGPPAERVRPEFAEFARAIMLEVGNMVDAKLSSLESRLPPAPPMRPPLAADKKKAEAAKKQIQTPKGGIVAQQPGPSHKKKKAKRKRGKKPSRPAPNVAPNVTAPVDQDSPSQPVRPNRSGETWTTVVKRGTKKRATVAASTKAPSREPPKIKLRPPRSQAVVVTLQPEAAGRGMTYAKVLTEAKSKIDLSSLGVSGMRIRNAATGARILEIPGISSKPAADALAAEIEKVIGSETVKVSRPTKCASLRIYGLDDSSTSEEVVEAIALVGGCPKEQIKVGELRMGPSTTGSVWASCPVAAAQKINNAKHLRIGWTSASVKLQPPKTMRCYRCLEAGHVGVCCQSEVDRSNTCYRCGQPGHKASTCNADPHCSICSAAGKPANHRVGGKACVPPSKKQRKKTLAATQPLPTSASANTEAAAAVEETMSS
ncbi:uncharacterized protein LOC125488949 [Plutella xylostella]|uniref:uncharacterized protein LOC125488949 n=1 Tax=Plutella xylostella TaxID=51655 RepID=UPI0020322529|nr:uncharacterized protein LOC125488949 [Plutella xylostella]